MSSEPENDSNFSIASGARNEVFADSLELAESLRHIDPSLRVDVQIRQPQSFDKHHESASNNPRITSTSFNKALRFIEDQWFLLVLGILIAIASQVQVPLNHQTIKRTLTSYLCISIIFFVYVLSSNVTLACKSNIDMSGPDAY